MDAVTILMATRNGAAHLAEQLASIARQDGVDWTLWVSDDGSTDASPGILRDFAESRPAGRVRLLQGPRQGAAANFLSLLGHPDLPPGPVAFADQDDIWYPGKLERALGMLAGTEGPGLYCAATRLLGGTDRLNRDIGAMTPSFGNALVQNFVAGNTAVLNESGASALRRMLPERPVPFHDWWLYLAMTAIGGQVICDGETVLDYRQHGDNLLGAHSGGDAGLARLRLLLSGHWATWVWANVRALHDHRAHLAAAHRATLEALVNARTRAELRRIMRSHGIARQSSTGTALIRALTRTGAFPTLTASGVGDTSGRWSGTPDRNPDSGSGGAGR